MNQQHRPFFQAVTSKANELQRSFQRAFRPCGRIAATCAVLLLISCTSLTPERVNLLAAIAGQAAQIGAQNWLAKHPEHRQSFELIVAAIAALVKQGETREFKYSELLQSLPTATLAGPDGAVYVTGTSKLSTNKEQDRILVYDEWTKKSYHVGGNIRVQRAVVTGLKRAMLPLPPMPVVSKTLTLPRVQANRVVVPVVWRTNTSNPMPYPILHTNNPASSHLFTPTVAFTNPFAATVAVAPVSPGESDAVPALQLSRTNVTRSVVDVTHSEGAASTVSVRWVLGPRSVYHVERKEEGGSWCRFASLTNSTATGPTNWCTAWPPQVEAGAWRVLRVR